MNTFGKCFRVSVFGESHAYGVGVMIDGCPPGISITEEELMKDIDRRRPGLPGTTPRREHDQPLIISGIYNGHTSGSPIVITTRNTNIRPGDYNAFREIPRPGHADFTAGVKYKGFADPRGGGHFSGRLTWGLVAAGTIARKILGGVSIKAVLTEAGGSGDIEKAVKIAGDEGDSIGGIIQCTVDGLKAGLGEPFFMPVEAHISQFVFSIPAVKGIEFGSGFAAASMKGSEHNDAIINKDGSTATNNAGGINGGITNGNQLVFRVAVKPTSTIARLQKSINISTGEMEELAGEGRHDVCIALRMPVIVESAAAVALADLWLTDRAVN